MLIVRHCYLSRRKYLRSDAFLNHPNTQEFNFEALLMSYNLPLLIKASEVTVEVERIAPKTIFFGGQAWTDLILHSLICCIDVHELISISLMVLLDRVTSSRIKWSTYNHRADRVSRKITSNMTPPEAAMYIPKEPVSLSEEGGRNCFVRCPRFGSV